MPFHNILSSFYADSLALLTDMYQLTMSYGYWKAGLDKKEAVFHLFFRKHPFQGGFTIAAGLENAIEYLDNFRFAEEDIAYLRSLKDSNNAQLFEEPFFSYLKELRFSCDVDAMPEGSVAFPYQPLIRVQGPLIQCQLLESPLLNLINFPTLIATKAARICLAAKEDSVFEFGMRRAQGIDGALTASRAAYLGGCVGTSNLLAGKLYHLPMRGTQSHGWIMVFEEEWEAFDTYAKVFPGNSIFLVDTYNSLEGVRKAIEIGKRMQSAGQRMLGIRLDSGDLTYLSIKSRALLDAAGFHDAKIVASNELDETLISELKRQGAKIDLWGVGTHLATGGSQASLDGVYKLSAIRDPKGPWRYKLKLSEQMAKVSNPGILQVRRFYQENGSSADLLYDTEIGAPQDPILVNPLDPTHEKRIKKSLEFKDLLQPIFRNGKLVYTLPDLPSIRASVKRELATFPNGIKRFLNPHEYPSGMEKTLYQLKRDLITNIRTQSDASI